jgi:hypothetical protein
MKFHIIYEETMRLWTWYLEDGANGIIVRPTHRGKNDKTAILNEIRRVRMASGAPLVDNTPKVHPPPQKQLHYDRHPRTIDEGFKQY